MIRFVRTWDEIKQNLLTLERYRISSNSDLTDYYRGLIRRGSCFVVYSVRGKVLFGPSRFIGYANNNRQAHESNPNKDGRETNPEIQKILGVHFLPNATLERQFQQFCRKHDIDPANKSRKFIRAKSTDLTDHDLLIDDLDQIKVSHNLNKTEKLQQVLARIGQGQFRQTLLQMWHGCPVTGCKMDSILRASHIKPWRACSDVEKLDPFNGLLLVPNLDSAFDQGLITFDHDGKLILSSKLKAKEAQILGIKPKTQIKLHKKHQPYLEYHRRSVFQK